VHHLRESPARAAASRRRDEAISSIWCRSWAPWDHWGVRDEAVRGSRRPRLGGRPGGTEVAAVILLLVGGFFFLVGWIEGNPVLARVRMAVAIAIPTMLLAGCGGNAAKAPSATAPSATLIVQQMQNAMKDATSVHIDGKVTPTSLKTFKARASLCRTECGKFVKIPANQAESISANFTMTGVLGGYTGELPSFTIQGTAIVKGVRVRVLRAVGTTIDVAAAGTPFPVVVDESGSFGNGELVFTKWNAMPAITAPPPGQVVSMSNLTG
jgi:hypothetical protein